MKTKIFQIAAYVVVIILIAALFINQQALGAKQEKMLQENNALVNANNEAVAEKLKELEAKVDTDTIVQIKECEMKAIQTVINIFSPREITKDSTLEYDFDIFSDEAYEYYLMQRRTFSGQQLVTAAANGSGYDAKAQTMQVFVPFFYSGFEGRTQFNFNFIKKDGKWVVETFSGDA